MECCHEKCVTRFCPQCGEAVQGYKLTALLQHCQAKEVKAKRRLQAAEEALPEQPRYEEKHGERQRLRRTIAKLTKTAAKWEHWVEGLEEVIGAEVK